MIRPQAAAARPAPPPGASSDEANSRNKAGQIVCAQSYFSQPWPAGTRHAPPGADRLSTAALPGAYGGGEMLALNLCKIY